MSLAYKLWKIGSVPSEDDIKKSIKVEPDFELGDELNYLNIDFAFEKDSISKITLNKKSIKKDNKTDKLFLTKKIGGSGTGIYYLYTEIYIQKSKPISCEIKNNKPKISNKLLLLKNTIEKSILNLYNSNNCQQIQIVKNELNELQYLSDYAILELMITSNKKNLETVDKPKEKHSIEKKITLFEKYLQELQKQKNNKNWNSKLFSVLQDIVKLQKDNYLIWFSINGQTFSELMPEVWGNYYKNPFVEPNTQQGFDIFTNEKTEIGYKTDFKVFSYDQYHDSLNYRLDENLPLSKESARNIKYAWMYILDNLVFYYKGLQYIIIPNLLTDDKEILKTVIKRFVKAKNRSSNKRTILEKLKKEEGKLKTDIEKLQKKKKDINKPEKKLNETHQEIDKMDLGMIKELHEQVETLGEYINIVTLDYLFVNIDRKNLSFELKGTIEDVIPSRMSKVVEKMREYQVENLVKLRVKNKDKTYLQDYFNRDEMELRKNRIPLFKERSSELKEYLFTERLHLAKLLLSDIKIKHSDLLKRFEFNRNYDYSKKKRMTKDGIKIWLQYPSSFVEDEENLIQFLQSLNKIQED